VSLRVTVVDEQTGETETQRIPDGDYLLIAVAPCYLSGVQSWGAAGQTHVLTIKDRRPQSLPTEEQVAVARVKATERVNPPYPGLVLNDPDTGL
jgi:hypothetical protein